MALDSRSPRTAQAIATVKPGAMATENANAGDSIDEIDAADPFEDVLNLEEQYHAEGFALGIADGTRAGRIEGRQFGLEKGFDKFFEMGQLGGRTAVWRARADEASSGSVSTTTTVATGQSTWRPVPGGDRLKKHLDRMDALTEAATMPTENSEDGVAAFDDRLRDAKAKAALVVKLVGDDHSRDIRTPHATASAKPRSQAPTGEMEDFVGLPQDWQKAKPNPPR